MPLEIRVLQGSALAAVIEDLAALRIAVFRDWPYLYDGDLTYEETYLAPYLTTPQAIVVGAFDGARLVGASTGMPLAAHADDFAAALDGTGLHLSDVFYCAESVLLPGYRGQGVGHQFFDHREGFARDCGYTTSAFCSVIRPSNHPARPKAYRPLDPFWRARGYTPVPGAIAAFEWKDIGASAPSHKQLQVWARGL